MTYPGDGIYTVRASEVLLGGQLVYPDGADYVPLQSGAADWDQGVATEIVPADTITSPFVLTCLDAVLVGVLYGAYQLDLYYGVADTYLCSVAYSFYAGEVKAARSMHGGLPGGVPIPANSRIRGQLRYEDATAGGAGGNTVALTYVEISS